jgi:hypothetical protein
MKVGCEDGVVLFDAKGATKISSPEAHGRISNQFSSKGSDIVLGDYRNDPSESLAVPQIALVNVVDRSLKVVDPFKGADVATTWRGLRRGDDGEVLVLGTDGAVAGKAYMTEPSTGTIYAVDYVTGKVTNSATLGIEMHEIAGVEV